jgi:hypothetical protein
VRRRAVTQDRALPARQDRREVIAVCRRRLVPDGVDAVVYAA